MARTQRSAPSHKEGLLKHGIRQFYATGYHGTGLDTLLASAGVPKGSFYHHFGSKEGFALAVLREYQLASSQRLEKWTNEPGLSAPERLRNYMEDMANAISRKGNRQGCLIGKFALELAPASDSFSAVLATMFDSWRSRVKIVIADGQAVGTIRTDLPSDALADLVLTCIQGAIVLCLAQRDSKPMRTAAVTVATVLSR